MNCGGVTETELAAKAAAPRVTLDQVEASIASEHYFTAAQGVLGEAIDPALAYAPEDLQLLTFCVLRLQNGFTVHGTSACADPANYNREIGERIARANAINQIWPLLGYELKTRLSLSPSPRKPDLFSHTTPLQGAYRPEGKAEPQASAASPAGAEEATGTSDETAIHIIARTCHQANRAYCSALGDYTQRAWEFAPQWQRDSAIAGVKFILANPNASPAASHESWLEEKEADGWKW